MLAKSLPEYDTKAEDLVVLGLPRGGVPVAYEVAMALGVPLDVFVVRKLGVPGFEELAMGAIASGDAIVWNEEVCTGVDCSEEARHLVVAAERRELERREIAYRGSSPPLMLQGKTVILVDDGLATGATMRAAIMALRLRGVRRCVVAVPVGAPDTFAEIRTEADDAICLLTPEGFRAVGQFYEDFSPTTDEEVCELLAEARKRTVSP